MVGRLEGRRVVVTQADRYLGPPVVKLFRSEGADVVADESDLVEPDAPSRLVEGAGHIDVLVANFSGPRELMPVTNMMVGADRFADKDFQSYLDVLVWPFLRVIRAVLPQMVDRGGGKIVGITSAAPHRAIPGLSVYSAARGAQNAFLQVVGNEASAHNVQVNAIGPAHIENNMYYTEQMLADESVRQQFEAQIPAGRLGVGAEAAELALCLASSASDFLAGQVIPICGGWVT